MRDARGEARVTVEGGWVRACVVGWSGQERAAGEGWRGEGGRSARAGSWSEHGRRVGRGWATRDAKEGAREPPVHARERTPAIYDLCSEPSESAAVMRSARTASDTGRCRAGRNLGCVLQMHRNGRNARTFCARNGGAWPPRNEGALESARSFPLDRRTSSWRPVLGGLTTRCPRETCTAGFSEELQWPVCTTGCESGSSGGRAGRDARGAGRGWTGLGRRRGEARGWRFMSLVWSRCDVDILRRSRPAAPRCDKTPSRSTSPLCPN